MSVHDFPHVEHDDLTKIFNAYPQFIDKMRRRIQRFYSEIEWDLCFTGRGVTEQKEYLPDRTLSVRQVLYGLIQHTGLILSGILLRDGRC